MNRAQLLQSSSRLSAQGEASAGCLVAREAREALEEAAGGREGRRLAAGPGLHAEVQALHLPVERIFPTHACSQ